MIICKDQILLSAVVILNLTWGCISSKEFKTQQFEKYDNFFLPGRMYTYKAVLTIAEGDTITNENIQLVPTGRPWIAQRNWQEGAHYLFYTDTIGLNKFTHPNPGIQRIHERYETRKQEQKYTRTKKNLTGGYMNETTFFLHPPRCNQYEFLRYAAYPWMESYNTLYAETKKFKFSISINFVGSESVKHDYIVDYSGRREINNTYVDCWSLSVKSNVSGLSEHNKTLGYHNSSCEGMFTKEYGFIKMHYSFENGMKILIDLINIKG